jgi:hypothetical protein
MKLTIIAGAVAFLATVGAAQAAGCGGYVNLAVWGCAPWDNNPPRAGVTPGYRAPAPRPVAQPRVAAPPKPVIQPGGRIVGDHGGGLISNNRGGILTDGGAGLLSERGTGFRR